MLCRRGTRQKGDSTARRSRRWRRLEGNRKCDHCRLAKRQRTILAYSNTELTATACADVANKCWVVKYLTWFEHCGCCYCRLSGRKGANGQGREGDDGSCHFCVMLVYLTLKGGKVRETNNPASPGASPMHIYTLAPAREPCCGIATMAGLANRN